MIVYHYHITYRFVAPTTSILGSLLVSPTIFAAFADVAIPSNCINNSVFTLLDASNSASCLCDSNESISSINITLGSKCNAKANNARTNFSL